MQTATANEIDFEQRPTGLSVELHSDGRVVHAVVRGGAESTMPPMPLALRRQLLDWMESRQQPEIRLARRERQVLEGLTDGMSYKEIAYDLDIGIETVRTYVRSLYRKLGVHCVAEAVGRALREGLV